MTFGSHSTNRCVTLVIVHSLLSVGVMAQEPLPLTPTAVALQITSGLEKDSSDFANASRYVALSHWRAGNIGAAFAQVESNPVETQLELLFWLASEGVSRKQRKLTQSIFTRALDVIASNKEALDPVWFSGFVERAIEIDDLEVAERFANFLDEGTPGRASQLIKIAKAWAKKNNKEQSISFVDRALKQMDAFDEHEREELIGLVTDAADVLVNLGEIERATALARRVSELLARAEEPNSQDELVVINLLARVGDISRAHSMLESSERVDLGLISMASVYQERGEETAALSMLVKAREIAKSDSESGYTAMSAPIIDAYLRLHRTDDAFDVLRSISDDSYYLWKSADKIADSYKVDRPRDALAVLDFAFSRIRLIVSEKSEDIPGSASFSRAQGKSQLLISLLTKYVELNSLPAAEAAAKEIDQPQYKAIAFSKVALAYSRANDNLKAKALLARAFELATESEEYNHDRTRDETLLEIAKGYASAGYKEAAGKVVLRLLCELRDADRCCSAPVEILMEIGRMVESEGISLDRESQRVLKQIAEQFVN